MRNQKQKIETTFGTVTIFKENKLVNPTIKTDNIQPPPKIDLNTNSESVETNKSDNFFGFEDAKLNYIDEQIFAGLNKADTSVNLENKNLNKQPQNDETCVDEQNYIDDYYFPKGTLNINEKNHLGDNTNLHHIHKKELDDLKDVNYIDQMMFQENQSDNLIGSIKNFKSNSIYKKNTLVKSAEIPIIKSQNILLSDSVSTPKKSLEINKNLNKTKDESSHKLLMSEVPNWDYITVDEGAAILQKNICYFNEERI